jgi:hypothetical protein
MLVMVTCPALPSFACESGDVECTEQTTEIPDSEQYPESDCVCTDCCNMIYIEPGAVEIGAVGEDTDCMQSTYVQEPSGFDSTVWNPPDVS